MGCWKGTSGPKPEKEQPQKSERGRISLSLGVSGWMEKCAAICCLVDHRSRPSHAHILLSFDLCKTFSSFLMGRNAVLTDRSDDRLKTSRQSCCATTSRSSRTRVATSQPVWIASVASTAATCNRQCLTRRLCSRIKARGGIATPRGIASHIENFDASQA